MPTFRTRLGLVTLALAIVSGLMIARLLSFQFRLDPEVQERLYDIAGAVEGREVEYKPNRGRIFDRDGQVLAVNTLEYRIGISPASIGADRETKRQVAKDLARALSLNESELFNLVLLPDEETGQYQRYVVLKSPATLEEGAAVEDLDIPGIVIEPIYHRDYPQEELTAQLVGFVNYNAVGYWGVEQFYQAELAGQSLMGTESGLPLDVSEDVDIRDGQDLVLTIDRDAQWIAQQVLEEYILAERQEYGAASTILGGQIIVMNPRTGEILAMVSFPHYTIQEYNNLSVDDQPPFNPAIHEVYEPGSIFKVITASVALDVRKPGLDLFWSYNNLGCEVIAGGEICDSETEAKGPTTFSMCLIKSLNTCTAHWNVQIGYPLWYDYLEAFGFGSPMGVDMAGEESGLVNWPGSPYWGEQNFVQTSFGQGISVTPLQMLTAANAIANDGLIMQPFIVSELHDGDTIYRQEPVAISSPISAASAQQVLGLMEQAVSSNEGFGGQAQIAGYTVAGKTGTAQKLAPDFSYSDTLSWASFIGFVPADEPYLAILVMLDQPVGYWGSQTAAPVFAEVASRLVVLFEIPPDNVRAELMNSGSNPFGRQ